VADNFDRAAAKAGPNSAAAIQLDVAKDNAGMLPGGTKSYPFLVDALGLLSASKRIHMEASAILYSKNTFVILPEHERVHCFWRCDNKLCRTDVPCFVHSRNIKLMKHICIIVNNPQRFENGLHNVCAKKLAINLRMVTMAFNELRSKGFKLKTLKIRYHSWLEGQVETVREHLNTHQVPGEPKIKSEVLRSSKGGKGYCVKAGQTEGMLFRNVHVLNALAEMPNIAEEVTILGDLPTQQVKHLVSVLSTKKAGKKTPAHDKPIKIEVAQMQLSRVEQEEDEHDLRAEFFGGLAAKCTDDPGMRDLCLRMMKAPNYPPHIMKHLFGPPTSEEMRRTCEAAAGMR
jgi:hypothetical protein